jgi:hypothetical protein
VSDNLTHDCIKYEVSWELPGIFPGEASENLLIYLHLSCLRLFFTDFLGIFRIEKYTLLKIILTFGINIWYISYFTVLISFLAL